MNDMTNPTETLSCGNELKTRVLSEVLDQRQIREWSSMLKSNITGGKATGLTINKNDW